MQYSLTLLDDVRFGRCQSILKKNKFFRDCQVVRDKVTAELTSFFLLSGVTCPCFGLDRFTANPVPSRSCLPFQ